MAKKSARTLVVDSTTRLTPNMQRIVFTGENLHDFPADQESGYFKLLVPSSEDTAQTVMRTYTIRAFDVTSKHLTVDFALHGEHGGPASRWAQQASVGDCIEMRGPGPKKLVNTEADWFVFAGDMTALPAIACNLEKLAEDAQGYAVIEITSEQDKQDLQHPQGIAIQWVINPTPNVHSPAFIEAVQAITWQTGQCGVWVACEFHSMRALRDYFRNTRKVESRFIYISSYWKIDDSEDQHKKAKHADQAAFDKSQSQGGKASIFARLFCWLNSRSG